MGQEEQTIAAEEVGEGEKYASKGHVFVVERRPRVYSEPYIDVTYVDEEAGVGEAVYTYCEVDYSRSDRVIKRFRKGYSEWRKGGAKGAKGQIGAVVAQAKEALASRKLVRRPSSHYSVLSSGRSVVSLARSQKLGFTNALLNSLNYNLGTSLLSVPYFMSRVGWVSVPLLVVFCLVSWATARFLGLMLGKTGAQSYADLCNYAFGKRFGRVGASVLRNVQVLELFSYVAYGNVALHDIVHSFAGDTFSKYNIYIVLFVCSTPMAVFRSKYLLTLCSKFGLFFYAVICGLILQDAVRGKPGLFHPSETSVARGGVFDYLQVGGDISLLFAGHAAIPSIYFSLKDEDDFAAVANYTSGILVLLALTLGSIGYASYGSGANPLLTINLRGDVVHACGQFSLLMKLYFSNYLIFSTLVREVEHMVAVWWLQPLRKNSGLDLDNDLEQALLANNSSGIIADMESLPPSSVYEEPMFDVFNFSSSKEEKEPEHIHTDPITRANMGRYLNLNVDMSEHLRNLRRSPLRYEMERRLTRGDSQVTMQDLPKEPGRAVQRVEAAIRAVLVVVAALVACFMPSVEFVMALIGGLLAVNVSITFPTVLYFYLGPKKARPLMFVLASMGIGLMLTSTYSTFRAEFA